SFTLTKNLIDRPKAISTSIDRRLTASSSIDGHLFDHVTFVTHLNLSDDSDDSSPTLLVSVTIATVSNLETPSDPPSSHHHLD
ncbi:hypothetical protein L195_g033737, partial [Trifolium pratense]